MEKQEIKICVRPYYHDVVKTITRKPKFNKTKDRHYIRLQGKDHRLDRTGGGFVIWIEEDDREKY